MTNQLKMPRRSLRLQHSHNQTSLDGTAKQQHTHLRQRQLPNEIVSIILNHVYDGRSAEEPPTLYQCALVSKQFYSITNPFIWKELDFDYNDEWDYYYTDADLFFTSLSYAASQKHQRLSALGQHIRKICLNGYQWTDDQLTRLLPHIPLLEHITLFDYTEITDTSFQQLPYHCQNLSTLILHHTELKAPSFSAIGQHCHQLSTLVWNITNDQSAEWLEYLKDCPLNKLRIDSESPLTSKAITSIQSFHLLTLLTIDVDCSSMDWSSFLLPPTTNGSFWPGLKTVCFPSVQHLDDTTCIKFINTHPHIEYLHLEEIEQLTDTSLDAIKTLANLMNLILSQNAKITPNGLRQLICGCPSLQHLELLNCNLITHTDFPEVRFYHADSKYHLDLDEKKLNKIRKKALKISKTTKRRSTRK